MPWRTWTACVVASVEPRVPTSKRRLLVIVFPSWGRGLSQVLVGRAVHGPRGGYSIFLRFLLLPLPTARVRTFHRADLLGHAGRQVKQRSQGIWVADGLARGGELLSLHRRGVQQFLDEAAHRAVHGLAVLIGHPRRLSLQREHLIAERIHGLLAQRLDGGDNSLGALLLQEAFEFLGDDAAGGVLVLNGVLGHSGEFFDVEQRNPRNVGRGL